MNIRLEYSQTEGKFNQAQANDPINVDKGYKTLCCFIESERAVRFTQSVTIKYPALASSDTHAFPSFSAMKDELYHFVEEDIKVLEEQMSSTYKRRKEIFSKHKPY